MRNDNDQSNIYLRHMSGIDGAYVADVSNDGGHVATDLFAYLVLQGGEHGANAVEL